MDIINEPDQISTQNSSKLVMFEKIATKNQIAFTSKLAAELSK